jgi:hypothetical protein
VNHTASHSFDQIGAGPARRLPIYSISTIAVLAAVAGFAAFNGHAGNAALDPACTSWDAAASAAIDTSGIGASARLQANEQNFRLRRARRNCREGWLNLACQDYRAIANGTVVVGQRELSANAQCAPDIAADQAKTSRAGTLGSAAVTD